jgi:nicotinate-nucleotide adenylyltransferase
VAETGRRTERWGILGGIFDPIHYGHLTIAEQALDALKLGTVVFMPAGQPVHKHPPVANAPARMRMVELAIADNPGFQVSDAEIKADRPSYTVDTMATLAAERPNVDWVLIVSSETASYMPTWREPERVLDLAELAIVSRLGHPDISREWIAHHFPGREERFLRVQTSHLGHSSTDIRDRVADRKSIRYLVPPIVAKYIQDNELYGGHRAAGDGRTPA